MIPLAKYSILILITISSISFSQKLSSFEVIGNINFDDQQYFQWSGLSLNQNIYPGILDSIKSRIARNVLASGFYYVKLNNSELIISNDSTAFNIVLEIAEGNPVVINKIILYTNCETDLFRFS